MFYGRQTLVLSLLMRFLSIGVNLNCSSFINDSQLFVKTGFERDNRHICSSPLINSTLVHACPENFGSKASTPTTTCRSSPSSEQPNSSFARQENKIDGFKVTEQSFPTRGLSSYSIVIFLNSWREGSRKQYRVYLKRWVRFCSERKIDPIRAPIASALDFLMDLYGITTLNTTSLVLSSIFISKEFVSFGSHPLVVRFVREVYNSRPSLPRDTEISDVRIVLKKLKEM